MEGKERKRKRIVALGNVVQEREGKHRSAGAAKICGTRLRMSLIESTEYIRPKINDCSYEKGAGESGLEGR